MMTISPAADASAPRPSPRKRKGRAAASSTAARWFRRIAISPVLRQPDDAVVSAHGEVTRRAAGAGEGASNSTCLPKMIVNRRKRPTHDHGVLHPVDPASEAPRKCACARLGRASLPGNEYLCSGSGRSRSRQSADRAGSCLRGMNSRLQLVSGGGAFLLGIRIGFRCSFAHALITS